MIYFRKFIENYSASWKWKKLLKIKIASIPNLKLNCRKKLGIFRISGLEIKIYLLFKAVS